MEVAFRQTTDVELIRRFATHPALVKGFVQGNEDWVPAMRDGVQYFEVVADGQSKGIVTISPVFSDAMLLVDHAMLLRGAEATYAAQQLFRFVWLSTTAECLVGFTPTDNRLACAFARRIGMEVIGVLPKSFKGGNGVVNLQLSVINRPEEYRSCVA
jgi:hypothetical protein